MEMRARYILIGTFVLAMIAAALSFTYWIQNTGGLQQRSVYEVRFDEPVSGLLRGSVVLFNGIRAGEVTALRLSPDHPNQVTARIAVNPGTPIHADTKVDIDFQGLTGTPSISLRGGTPGSPKLTPSEREPPLLIAEPSAGKPLTQAAREALRRLDTILSDNAQPLHSTITNLSTFSDVLARNSDRIDGILAGLERLTGGGTPKAPPPTYDLQAPSTFPALEKKPDRQIAVSEPAAVLMFDTQKILVRSNGAYSALDNAQWSDNLPKLVQAKLVQTFENADFVQSVSRQMDDLTADYRVMINIRSFQLSLSPDPGAEVEFAARILDSKGQIVDGRIFTARVPVGSSDPAMAVPALNKAFAQAARDLVVWVTGLI